MLLRALAANEKALGPENDSTLDTFCYLGCLYPNQGRFADAEQMYYHDLAGKVKAFGPDHIETLKSVASIGHLYARVALVEKTYRRLAGFEKALGPEHVSMLDSS